VAVTLEWTADRADQKPTDAASWSAWSAVKTNVAPTQSSGGAPTALLVHKMNSRPRTIGKLLACGCGISDDDAPGQLAVHPWTQPGTDQHPEIFC
jgi:hypothetical protein